MPKKTGIKASDYEGQLRRPGEKRDSSTTQDGDQQEKESEKGENFVLLLAMIVNFGISAAVV